MKRILLGTIAPIAIAMIFTGAAYAENASGPSATASAGYAFGLNRHLSNIYGSNATVQIPFDASWAKQFGFEALGGYHRPDSGQMDFWYLGGALYAGDDAGRVAANYTYHNIAGVGVHLYGAGGEWFVAPNLNLAVHGGGVTWDHGHGDGGYVGAQGTWYVGPDFALSGNFDYWSAAYNQSSETVQAEWLPSEYTPVSVYTGYQHINQTGSSFIFAGVKLYLNDGGAAALVDRQRNDTNGYIIESPKYLDQF